MVKKWEAVILHNQIQIHVANEQNLDRVNEPINVGIPIPEQLNLTSTTRLSLQSADGVNIPCQVTPLAWWSNKSIKWVLLHFQASVTSQQTAKYDLIIDDKYQQSEATYIAQVKDEQIIINTGQLQATLGAKAKFDLIVQLLGTQQYAGPRLKLTDGTVLTPGISDISIDENGSEKAVIKFSGNYVDAYEQTSDFEYVLRVEFYRDKAYCRVFNTIISVKESKNIAEVAFVLPDQGHQASIYSSDGSQILTNSDVNNISLLHDDHDTYQCHVGQKIDVIEKRFQGWVSGKHVLAGTRFFWQMYPKSIEVEGQEIRLGLLPQISQNKDSFKPCNQVIDHYRFAAGEARTHEIMLSFGQAIESADQVAIFNSLNEPLIGHVAYEWYTQSGVFGDLSVRDDKKFPQFEQLGDDSLKMILARRENLNIYGDRNFGDDLLGEQGMWNNCEYDYPHVGVLQFVRGADPAWYTEFALPAARHMYNIDYANAGQWAGLVHPHTLWHNSGRPKLGSHSWLQGTIEYFLLSGDYRAKDLAELVGNRWCDDIIAAESLGGTERAITWPLVSMLALYQVTAADKYLQAAQKIRDRVVELFDFELGYFTGCMQRDNYAPSYWQVFLMGSPVLESLIMYYETFNDQEIKAIIIAIAKRLAKENWIEELGEWEYTRTRGIRGHHTPKNNRMVSPSVAYAALYADDQDLWDKAVTAFNNTYGEVDGQGKEMTQSLRWGVKMPALLAKVENKD